MPFPAGVPFALAPTAHWSNTVVLGELIFAGLENTLGDRGLMLAQLLAVTGGPRRPGPGRAGRRRLARWHQRSAAAGRCRRTAEPRHRPRPALLAGAVSRPGDPAAGGEPAPLPSHLVVVPLLALWSNLHGAVLLGLLVLIVYLVLDRGRREPLLAVAVAAAGVPGPAGHAGRAGHR